MQHEFDGSTYDSGLDQQRLSKQFETVKNIMLDGAWHTYSEIRDLTGFPTQSISARVRDLRKPRFGNYRVERERVEGGLYQYRIVGQWSQT